MSVNQKKITGLLEKTKHYDADERFMAVQDLVNEIKSLQSVDPSLQVPVRNAILSLLDDKSPNVSTIAVKCLSQLVQMFATEQVTFIVDRLGSFCVDDTKNESRDVVADGLKSVMSAISEANGKLAASGLSGHLVRGLQSSKKDARDFGNEMVLLDVLKDLLERYGSDLLLTDTAAISQVLGQLLEHPAEPVRKRASVTLGPLVLVLSDADFVSLVKLLMERLKTSNTPETYVQSISVLTRHAGVRIGQDLPQIMPTLFSYLSIDAATSQKEEDEKEVELWENCLQALESVIRQCPAKVSPYVPTILPLAKAYLCWDPNYSYEGEEEEGEKEGKKDADEDEGFGGDDEGWGDDDGGDWGAGEDDSKKTSGAAWGASGSDGVGVISADSSWRVRRAAASVLSSFITVKTDILGQYYQELCKLLVSRFKERDGSVKEAALLATRDLLHEALVNEHATAQDTDVVMSPASPSSAVSMDEDDGSALSLSPPLLRRTRSSYETLDALIPGIVSGCSKQFSSGDARTQKAVLAVLSELCVVRRGVLDIEQILPLVITGLSSTDLEALRLLQLLLEYHSYAQLQASVSAMAQALCALVASGKSSVPEGLRAVASLVKLIAPNESSSALCSSLLHACLSQLSQRDVPPKLKLAAIGSTATVIAACANAPGKTAQAAREALEKAAPLFKERLGNDQTRPAALRAIRLLAVSAAPRPASASASASSSSSASSASASSNSNSNSVSVVLSASLLPRAHSLDLGVFVNDVAMMADVAQYLRKNQASLREQAASTLLALVWRHGDVIKKEVMEMILEEAAQHISASELQLTSELLDLCAVSMERHAALAAQLVHKRILPIVLDLVRSSVLQGAALQSCLNFFQSCVRVAKQSDALSPSSLTSSLLSGVEEEKKSKGKGQGKGKEAKEEGESKVEVLGSSSRVTVAKCIAAVNVQASAAELTSTVQRFVNQLSSAHVLSVEVALLVLGELGQTHDLCKLVPNLLPQIFALFDSKDEALRQSASASLGGVAVASLSSTLPSLLSRISDNKFAAQRALLIRALRTTLGSVVVQEDKRTAFVSYAKEVLNILMQSASSPDEGVRDVVGQCLGLLCIVSSSLVLPALDSLRSSAKADDRVLVMLALRASFSPLVNWSAISERLDSYLSLLRDQDLSVRRQALITCNALVRANHDAITRHTMNQTLLPALYAETKKKAELVREVDYGAFKEIVDDGLPLRKAAFQTLSTLLDVCSHRLNISELIQHAHHGLADHVDIQVPTFESFINLAQYHGSSLLEVLDALPSLIMKSVKEHLTAAKGANGENSADALRTIVRALCHFNRIPGVELCTKYTHFFKQILATPLLAAMLKEMEAAGSV